MDKFRLHAISLVVLLLLGGCASPFDREVRVEPAGKHNLAADKEQCREYAELYGVINLGPMVGDGARNHPDRQRRNHLFVLCMEEKGYRF